MSDAAAVQLIKRLRIDNKMTLRDFAIWFLIFEFEAKCHDIVMCNERIEFYDFTILSLFFHIDRIDLHDTIDITAYTLVSDKLEINETSSVAVLWAESVWGILRGLETFSQILAPSGDGPSVNIRILVFSYS